MRPLLALILAVTLFAADVRFRDQAARAGLTDVYYCGSDVRKNYIIETLGTGVALIDYDQDGWLDLFAVNASRLEGFPKGQEPTNHLYRNNRDGTFRDVTREAGLVHSGWGQGVCAGDFDNDGFDDLYVTYWGHDVLYRNTGKGKFEDVTASAGLASGEVRWATGCAFLDFNKDSRLDLFVANYVQFDMEHTPTPSSPNACKWKNEPVMCGPRGLKGGVNRLFRNDSTPGTIKFTDVSESSGIAKPGPRYSLSVTTLDYDHDGLPDIYVAVDSQASILYHNNGDGSFTDTGVEAGVAYSDDGREQAGMGTAAGDYNGDGLLDLVKTNFVDDTPNLYRNRGDGSFEEVTVQAGMGSHRQFLGWGAAFLDYDNDGWPDIFWVNGHVYPGMKGESYHQRRVLLRNLGTGRFQDVTAQAGAAEEHSSRGLAVGDIDNDGDLDIVVSNMNAAPSLLINEGGNAQNYLSLRLTGSKSNRNAIGARVTLFSAGRKFVQEVRSGSTFMSHSDFRLHFGLGAAKGAERIEIEWPSGKKQTLTAVKANQFLAVSE